MFLYFLKSLILIHNHEVAGSIPAPATEDRLLIEGLGRFLSLKSFFFLFKNGQLLV